MRKRLICIALAFVLVLGILPAMTLVGRAESVTEMSQEGIDLLKQFEGFRAKPYWDYTQYSVGYGTKCPDEHYDRYMEEGISEEEAEELLMAHVVSKGAALKKFIEKFELTLNQAQYDALMLFTYNVGSGWTTKEGIFRSAVTSGATGNEFIYAMVLWCKADKVTSDGLIRRRLAEANLYLNGVYMRSIPENYSFVRFDPNGGEVDYTMQGYDINSPTEIRVIMEPEYTDANGSVYEFAGWYTAKKGGNLVTQLDSTLAYGVTLYAHWNKVVTETPEESTGATTQPTVPPTTAPTVPPTTVPTVPPTTAPTVPPTTAPTVPPTTAPTVPPTTAPTVPPTSKPTTPPTETVKGTEVEVTGTRVNIRTGPGTGYSVCGTALKGQIIVITETAEGNGYLWGKFSDGWICLDYTTYDTGKMDTTEVTGTVVNINSSLNIRSGAGTGYDVVGKYYLGDRVTILEQKTVGTDIWGRTELGWISMQYIQLDTTQPEATTPPTTAPTVPPTTAPTAPPATTPTTPPTTAPTVPSTTPPTSAPTTPPETQKPADSWVGTATGSLRIRSGAGTSYTTVGYLKKGDVVTVTERILIGDVEWGKIEKGWISLKYISFGAVILPPAPTQPSETVPPQTKPEVTEPEVSEPTEDTVPEETNPTLTEGEVNWIATLQGDAFLQIRSGAGEYYSIVGYLRSGTETEITECVYVAGTPWGLTDKGWVSLENMEIRGQEQTEPGREMMVNTSSLRIRSGAGKSNGIVAFLRYGETVQILQTETVNGVLWGRIKQGWVDLRYLK